MIKKRSRRRGKKIRCEREKMWRRPTSSSTSKCPMSIQTLHRYLIKRFFPFGQIFRSDYDFSLMRCRKKCVILLSIFPSWAVHVTYIHIQCCIVSDHFVWLFTLYGFTHPLTLSFHFELLLLTRRTGFIWHELCWYDVYQKSYSPSCLSVCVHTMHIIWESCSIYIFMDYTKLTCALFLSVSGY